MSGTGLICLLLAAAVPAAISVAAAAQRPVVGRTHNISTLYAGAPKSGGLDCNGNSPAQSVVRPFNCTDIRGLPNVDNQNNWNNRFWDNGVYIGHDEPDATFLSTRASSGNNVTWNLKLGADPSALPTTSHPGSDVSHYFELTPAPWLSMALCDPNSYPQLPCKPNSNGNAPAKCTTAAAKCSPNLYPGGGSAFMELQFYPPGNAPWIDSESCDNAHWCAALTIDSLECTDQYQQCNTSCEEPINFSFVQTDGIPPGPPSPQLATRASAIQNANTLLMNPGDNVGVHISDQPVPGGGGQKALLVVIHDATTGKTGYMQASAKNGFQNTSIVNCSGTPFNFQPEYSSAAAGNYIPWAALQTNVSTEFETGHFEPCTSLSGALTNPFDPSDVGGTYNGCAGSYESAGGPEVGEPGDALCYNAGDVHAGYDGNPSDTVPPNEVTGCQANVFQNGDLDFDGSAYYAGEWPTSKVATASVPSSFVESLPQTGGHSYSQLFFQTDVALSELNSACGTSHPKGCEVPPSGPGHFYPYWSEANHAGVCTLEFGNVHTGVTDFGKDAQYGTSKLVQLGYPEFVGKTYANSCPAH